MKIVKVDGIDVELTSEIPFYYKNSDSQEFLKNYNKLLDVCGCACKPKRVAEIKNGVGLQCQECRRIAYSESFLKVKDYLRMIGELFFKKTNDCQKTNEKIERLGIVDAYMEDERLVLKTTRPGKLIGVKGKTISEIEEYLNVSVKIIEEKINMADFMLVEDLNFIVEDLY